MNNIESYAVFASKWTALSLLAFGVACTPTLRAPTPPPIQALPTAIPFTSQIRDGEGATVLETDQPALVREGKSGKIICERTPCSFAGELGPHELSFVSLSDPTRQSRAAFTLVPERTIVRHTLGKKARSSSDAIAWLMLGSFGLAVTVAGAAEKGRATFDTENMMFMATGSTLMMAGLIGAIASAPSATPGTTEQFRF